MLLADTSIGAEVVLSAISFTVTVYFWFVQARREKPDLRIFQIRNFRATCRRNRDDPDTKRLMVQQLDSCGVLIANNSTRQNSIVMFECAFQHQGAVIQGDWGYVDNDKPPWNIGPESTISMGLACFFDVPADFEVPDDFRFLVDFITASGQRFRHEFSRQARNLGSNSEPLNAAA